MENQRILCVDDNQVDLVTLKAVLKEFEADIVFAKSGKEALILISEGDFTLAILDVLMPEMDGYQLAWRIKKIEKTKNLPIIFLSSAYSDDQSKLMGYESGAVDFITKPFEKVFLVSKVRIFLQLDKMHKELKQKVEIEKSKNYLESILQSTKEAIIVINFDCKVMMANNSALNFWQYSSEVITGLDATTLVKGDSFTNWLGNLKKYSTNKDTSKLYLKDTEVFILTKKGHSNAAIINCSPLCDSENRVHGGVLSATDLAERRFIENVIWENEEKLRYICAYANDGILMIDQRGKICFWNNAASSIFGYCEEEVYGKDLHSILVPERYHETFKIGFSEFLKTGEGNIVNKRVEFFAIRKSGEEFPVELSLSAIKINKKWNAIGLVHDISERRKAITDLIKAKEKAEESDRLKAAFIHNISHEIRTPMNAIVGFSSLIDDPDLPFEEKSTFTSSIVESSNQLLLIITDLVEISNIEARQVKVVPSLVIPGDLMNNLIKVFSQKAETSGVSFKVENDLRNKNLFICTDISLLQKIMEHLITNAIKFSSGGEIVVYCNESEESIQFCVKDSGIGISPEYQQRIFEPFYQIENSLSRDYGGTGLGLAITKAYVELLGSTIEVESKQGVGSEFSFKLPYVKESKELHLPVKREVKGKGKFTKTILVAENDINNYNLIATFLADSDISLIHAINGSKALEICRSEQKVHLVLMDLRMPVMDGYEATRQIKILKPDLPIIAQTAYADDRDKVKECGCSGFISKPFDKNQLLSIVNEFL